MWTKTYQRTNKKYRSNSLQAKRREIAFNVPFLKSPKLYNLKDKIEGIGKYQHRKKNFYIMNI